MQVSPKRALRTHSDACKHVFESRNEYSRGHQSYLQRAVVAAGFHFRQKPQLVMIFKNQDQVIKQLVLHAALAQNETLQPYRKVESLAKLHWS